MAMSVLLICTPALADVGCVQTELARIGLDPGPVAGQLGRKTLSAARAFQEGAPYLQDLTVDTSYNWCKALKEQPALASFNSNQGLGGLGTVFDPAMDTTPVLGQTPEYQVPNWVNNPR
ncbi:MAG: hypothetical protein ABIY37_09885 [Devosia sp.]